MSKFKIFVITLWTVFIIAVATNTNEVKEIVDSFKNYEENTFEGMFTVLDVDHKNNVATVKQGEKTYLAYSEGLQVGDTIYLHAINDDIITQYKVQY